jgi:hypothetical protein
MMLNGANARRRDHIVDEFTLDKAMATTLHGLVTKSTQSWTNPKLPPSDVPAPTGGKYQALWFYAADTAALFSSVLAVDGWYTGNKQYDWATWKCKHSPLPAGYGASTSVADGNKFFAKIKTEMDHCNNFRGLVWKPATTAAFAVRDSWAVAWIQYPNQVPKTETYTFPARTTKVAFGTATAVDDNAQNKLYVLKKCLKAGYNECVANAELAAHNDARLARKGAAALTLDAKASAKIQAMLNDKTKGYAKKTTMPDLHTLAGAPYTNCIQSVYNGAYTPGKATEEWLKGAADIVATKPVPASLTAAKKQLAYAFVEIVWKSATTVGFGQKDQYLVAWYCASPAPNLSALTEGTDFDKTETCIKDAYNACFNTAATTEANKLRVQHKAKAFAAIAAATDNPAKLAIDL